MTTYTDKVAFVTGAASGIGYALCEALMAKGAKVMMADIDKSGLADALKRLGGTSASLASVSKPTAKAAIF